MTYLQNKLHSGICLSEFSNCMVAKIKFEVETEARGFFSEEINSYVALSHS